METIEVRDSQKLSLIIIKNPFDLYERETVEIDYIEAKTIADYCKEIFPDTDCVVFRNGTMLDESDLTITFLNPNDSLVIKPKVGAPAVMAAVALIAKAAATYFLGQTFLASLVAAGITLVAGLVVSALLPPPVMEPEGVGVERSYSWSGPANTQQQGLAVPIVYGEIRTGGNIIASYLSTDGEKQYIHLLICMSIGPIESISDIEINDQPASNFAGVTMSSRTGAINQSCTSHFQDTIVEYSMNVKCTYNNPYTYTTVGNNFHALDIELTWPEGLYDVEDGEADDKGVNYKVEARRQGDSWTTVWSGSVRAEWSRLFRRVHRYHVSSYGVHEIRVTRESPDDSADVDEPEFSDIYLTAVREIYGDDFTYPRHALLSLSALATDQLSGTIKVTARVKGRKVRVWNGSTWNVQYSDNPAWIAYDILTFPVYNDNGTVNRYTYFDPSNLDENSFKEWAEFCNELVSDGKGGQRQRYTWNGIFEDFSNIWEAAMQVATEAQATLIFDGVKIRAIVDKPGIPVQMFTVGNILESSMSGKFIGYDDRAGQIEVNFRNKDKEYEMDTITIYDSSLSLKQSNKTSITLRGCTDSAQAWAFAMLRLRANNYLYESCSIEVDIDAIACKVGDVVLVQHDVTLWGEGGRLKAVNSSTQIVLDKQVTMVAGHTYKVRVRTSDDSIQERTVQTQAGTTDIINVTSAFNPVPQQYDIYAFYEVNVGKEIRPFKVTSITPTSYLRRKLDLIEYNESIYSLGTPVVSGYIPDPSSIIAPVTNLSLKANSYLDPSGIEKSYINVSFNIPSSPTYGKALVYFRKLDYGNWILAGQTTDSYFTIENVVAGKTYEVMVVALSRFGLQSASNPSASITVPHVHLGGYINKRVTGLQIFKRANQNTFTGKDCVFVWNDIAVVSGSTADPNKGAGHYRPAVWFKDYEITIKDNNGNIRRVEYVTEPRYVYTYEKNYDDGDTIPVRKFTIEVKARDRYFRVSREPARLTVSNPAPPVPSNISVTGFFEAINIQFEPSSVPDVAGYKIHASQTPEFTPTENNLVNRGPETSFLMTDVTGTWYIKIAAYDTFGEDSLNYSNEYSATAEIIPSADTTPPAVPTGLNLTTGVSLGADGTEFSWIRATWTANTEDDLSHYEFRIKEDGGNYRYGYVTSNEVLFSPVRANILHYVAVRAIDKSNNKSDFCSEQSITAAKDTTPPSAPSGLSAAASFHNIFLDWTNPTDSDFACVEVWRADSNNRSYASKIAEVRTDWYVDRIGSYGTTRYYWIRAKDWSGNLSDWHPAGETSGISATTAYVDYADINDFAIKASKIFTKIPILDGDSWTDNSPSSGYISWNQHDLYYNGSKYTITAGNTNLKYIYWIGGTTYQSSNTNPNLTDSQFLIATNIDGYHDLAWNAIANQVIGSAYIQDAAIVDAKINDLSADKINAGYLNADRIATNSLILEKLNIGSFHNLLEDHNFEFGTNGIWTYNSGWSRYNGEAYSGSYCARKSGNSIGNEVITTRYISCFPGEKYTFRAYVKSSAECSDNAGLRIYWYKADKTASSTPYNGVAINLPNTTYQQYSITATVPSDAAFCRFAVRANSGIVSGQYVYVDFLEAFRQTGNVHIENGAINADKIQAGSITSNEIDTSTLTADVLAVGEFDNLAIDGDFEESYAKNWTNTTSFTESTDSPQSGNKCIKYTCSTSDKYTYIKKYFRCHEGEQIYFRGYARKTSDYNGTPNRLLIVCYDKDKNSINTSSVTFTPSESWELKEITATAPANTCYVRVGIRAGSNTTPAGSIYFDNLYAKKLSGRVLIEDGAITTDKLYAQAVTADKVTTGELITLSAQIKDGIITNAKIYDLDAAKITTGYLDSNRIDANSITADKLMISDHEDLASDGDFEDDYTKNWTNTTYYEVVNDSTVAYSGNKCIRCAQPTTAKDTWTIKYFRCRPGEQFYGYVYGKTSSDFNSSTGYTVRVCFYDKDKAIISGWPVGFACTINTVWTKREFTVTAPAGACYVRVGFRVTGNASPSGYAYFDCASFLRMKGTVLIENGAITASKIDVNSLSAINANIGTCTSGKIQNSSGSNYVNLDATGTQTFISVANGNKVDIKADGSGTFAREIVSEPIVIAHREQNVSIMYSTDENFIYFDTDYRDPVWRDDANKSFIGRAKISAGSRWDPQESYAIQWKLECVVFQMGGLVHNWPDFSFTWNGGTYEDYELGVEISYKGVYMSGVSNARIDAFHWYVMRV